MCRKRLAIVIASILFFLIQETQISHAANIRLIPVSIRYGIESAMLPYRPLEDSDALFESKWFKEPQSYALKSGIYLNDFLDIKTKPDCRTLVWQFHAAA
jgi:hypothetical protein